MNSLLKTLTLLMAALSLSALVGCAAQVKNSRVSGLNVLIDPSEHIQSGYAMIVASESVQSAASWPTVKALWQSSLQQEAQRCGIEMTLIDALPTSVDAMQNKVAVLVEINDYRYVPAALRLGLGAMTGNAYVDAHVRFIRLPEQRSVAVRAYQTSSSTFEGVWSAMTSAQIDAINEQIVRELKTF